MLRPELLLLVFAFEEYCTHGNNVSVPPVIVTKPGWMTHKGTIQAKTKRARRLNDLKHFFDGLSFLDASSSGTSDKIRCLTSGQPLLEASESPNVRVFDGGSLLLYSMESPAPASNATSLIF